MPHRLAIFASGSGSNAQKIMEYFAEDTSVEVSLVLSNRASAKVLERAENFNVPAQSFNRQDFYETGKVLQILKEAQIDWLILAGFLWLVPQNLIEAFPQRIINLHPALLPKYGGKGMYGANVHRAVHAAGERESGITIHYVNEYFDEGEIIFQASCQITAADTPESIAQKVQVLEHQYFPKVIAELLQKLQ